MAKILKNNTASDIFLSDVGQIVPASGQLVVDPSDYDKYAQSTDTESELLAENLTLNNGLDDLPIDEALNLIRGIYPVNFSYSKIRTRRDIEDDQQMVVLRKITIDDELFINGDGELVVL